MTKQNKFMTITSAILALGLSSAANATSHYKERTTTTTTKTSSTTRLPRAISPDPSHVAPEMAHIPVAVAAGSRMETQYSEANRDNFSREQLHAYDRSQVITFASQSAVLSAADKNKIRRLVSSLGKENIDRIELAVWSDKALPRTGTALTIADRDLARERIRSIDRFLKQDLDISGMTISSYNMAEPANWLARTFRTDDAELKSAFAFEANTPMEREDFNLIYREGAPSRAVLVLVGDK